MYVMYQEHSLPRPRRANSSSSSRYIKFYSSIYCKLSYSKILSVYRVKGVGFGQAFLASRRRPWRKQRRQTSCSFFDPLLKLFFEGTFRITLVNASIEWEWGFHCGVSSRYAQRNGILKFKPEHCSSRLLGRVVCVYALTRCSILLRSFAHIPRLCVLTILYLSRSYGSLGIFIGNQRCLDSEPPSIFSQIRPQWLVQYGSWSVIATPTSAGNWLLTGSTISQSSRGDLQYTDYCLWIDSGRSITLHVQ